MGSFLHSQQMCFSWHLVGLHGTCHVSAKPLTFLVRVCVLGTPDDSSLLREDDPHNLKGGSWKAKGAAMVSASA